MLISPELIKKALDAALSTGADFAEVFVEESFNNGVSLVDSRVDSVSSAVISGLGIRVYSALRSASASTSDLSEESLQKESIRTFTELKLFLHLFHLTIKHSLSGICA